MLNRAMLKVFLSVGLSVCSSLTWSTPEQLSKYLPHRTL